MKLYTLNTLFWLVITLQAWAQQDSTKYRDVSSPGSVMQQINIDKADTKISAWYALDSLDQIKNRFYEKTGFIVNLDYNIIGMTATEVISDNNSAASGVFRAYGKYNFVGRGTGHEGGLIFKVEHRHKYTENPPREFSLLDVGYAGLVQSVFNDQKWRLTNLYWRQTFGSNRIVGYFGFVDMTDWTDVHAAASPWLSFNNPDFATGSLTIGGLYPDGSLGLMMSAWLSEEIYIVGSLTDVNGMATEFWKSFDTFFSEFDTVKTLEIGYSPGLSSVFVKNA